MNIVFIYLIKAMVNFLGITFIKFRFKIKWLCYLPGVPLLLIDFIQSAIIIKRSNEFKRRYHRKRYKMQRKNHIVCIMIENIALLFLYIFVFDSERGNNLNFDIFFQFVIHFFILNIPNIGFFIDLSQYFKNKSNAKVRGSSFEMGVIRGRVKKDGVVVLEDNEMVQILDRINEMVTVRKGNGDEFTIRSDIVKV